MKVELYNKRNMGIECLRIISMIMVVLLHVLGSGGILGEVTFLSTNYKLSWLLEIIAYCSVNCYALISGYVGVDSKFKYSNIIFLWLRVFFYTILISGLFFMFIPNTFTIENVLKAVFPVFYNQYWYFTSYFCMFFFIPYMNLLLNKLDKKSSIKLIITIIVLFCLFYLIQDKDIFLINKGYSVLWLSCLYMIGGCIKRHNLFKKWSNLNLFCGFVLCTFITWLYKILIELLIYNLNGKVIDNMFLIDYNSITFLFQAIFLLVLFSRIKIINGRKWIEYFSKLSFSVYLIHNHPFVIKYLISNRFIGYIKLPPYLFLISLIGSVICIFIISIFIDMFRNNLFEILKIKKNCEILVKRVYNFAIKILPY